MFSKQGFKRFLQNEFKSLLAGNTKKAQLVTRNFAEYMLELRDDLEWVLDEYKKLRKDHDFKKMNNRIFKLEDKVKQLELKVFKSK